MPSWAKGKKLSRLQASKAILRVLHDLFAWIDSIRGKGDSRQFEDQLEDFIHAYKPQRIRCNNRGEFYFVGRHSVGNLRDFIVEYVDDRWQRGQNRALPAFFAFGRSCVNDARYQELCEVAQAPEHLQRAQSHHHISRADSGRFDSKLQLEDGLGDVTHLTDQPRAEGRPENLPSGDSISEDAHFVGASNAASGHVIAQQQQASSFAQVFTTRNPSDQPKHATIAASANRLRDVVSLARYQMCPHVLAASLTTTSNRSHSAMNSDDLLYWDSPIRQTRSSRLQTMKTRSKTVTLAEDLNATRGSTVSSLIESQRRSSEDPVASNHSSWNGHTGSPSSAQFEDALTQQLRAEFQSSECKDEAHLRLDESPAACSTVRGTLTHVTDKLWSQTYKAFQKMGMAEAQHPSFGIAPSNELIQLYRLVFGERWRSRIHDLCRDYYFSCRDVLVALIGASIHLHVLECPAPIWLQHAISFPNAQYEQYAREVMKEKGVELEDLQRGIAMAAATDKRQIAAQATWLMESLAVPLLQFLQAQPSCGEGVIDLPKSLKLALTAAFEQVIALKYRLEAEGESLSCHWYPSESSFDPTSMQVGLQLDSQELGNKRDRHIAMCILPWVGLSRAGWGEEVRASHAIVAVYPRRRQTQDNNIEPIMLD